MSYIPKHAQYLAIRGNITKEILKRNKIKLNENVVLCDPGLLLSRLYMPTDPIEKKYKIGIIAHYTDEATIRRKYGNDYHVISMDTNDMEALAREILACEIILSSSLHGIIFAHSYGIPAYHIQFKDFFNNGNFKFADYYSAFNGLIYRKFKELPSTNNKLDFDKILKFHEKHCKDANPTREQIREKQDDFLKVLPYRKYLLVKYGGQWGKPTV